MFAYVTIIKSIAFTVTFVHVDAKAIAFSGSIYTQYRKQLGI